MFDKGGRGGLGLPRPRRTKIAHPGGTEGKIVFFALNQPKAIGFDGDGIPGIDDGQYNRMKNPMTVHFRRRLNHRAFFKHDIVSEKAIYTFSSMAANRETTVRKLAVRRPAPTNNQHWA